MDPIEPTPEPASPRDPIAFGRLLREGEAVRTGSMPAKLDALIRAEIRADFGFEAEAKTEAPPPVRTVRPATWWGRWKLVVQPIAAVAAVALVFLGVRDWFLPGVPDVEGEQVAVAPPSAEPPAIQGQSVSERLAVACAARASRRFEALEAALASLVVAADMPIMIASPDLPSLDLSGIGIAEVEAVVLPPKDPAAAFGVWEVQLKLPDGLVADHTTAMVGWRVAIDLGGLEVVAIGDGVLADFTSPPAYDPASLARGLLLLAAVSPNPVDAAQPITVARLQARRLADGTEGPSAMPRECVAAIQLANAPPPLSESP